MQKLLYATQFQTSDENGFGKFPATCFGLSDRGKTEHEKTLTDFQNFWRENSEICTERFQYKEASPHLILMAFLQRIINTGGRIDREMATGSGRIDLCIHYENHRYPVEIKIRRDKNTLEEGKKQLAGYMDRLGCDEGWLVIFDRRKKTPWKTKLFLENRKIGKPCDPCGGVLIKYVAIRCVWIRSKH